MTVLFKDPSMQREYSQLHPRLRLVVEVMGYLAMRIFGDVLVVTSIKRNDGSTHANPPPYRFIDFAILENGGIAGTEILRDVINILFPRTDGRDTIVELRHGTAPHAHVQVRP